MPDRLLLDTNILIDFLRSRSEATQYVRSLIDRPYLSSVTVAELYAGVREGKERVQLEALVSGFRVVPLTTKMAVAGGLYMRQFAKSHSVGLADGLIAATASEIGARLVTLNQRHFPMLADLLVPYNKS
jgi:predicted nucleic acid-binding protein